MSFTISPPPIKPFADETDLPLLGETRATAEQAWRQLAELGCHLAQGYHISRPLPEPDITRWLQAREAPASEIELLAQV